MLIQGFEAYALKSRHSSYLKRHSQFLNVKAYATLYISRIKSYR
jgi:hypothetical protein